MPYSNSSSHQPTRSTRKRVVTRFRRSDGTPGIETGYEETCKLSENDIDELKVAERHELACGCLYPDSPAAGVCQVCAGESANPNICKKHLVTCHACGISVCTRHSCEDGASGARLCERCYLKSENSAAIASCVSWLKQLVRAVFWK